MFEPLRHVLSSLFRVTLPLFVLCFLLITPPTATAQNDDRFETTLETTYTVEPSGTTTISHQFAITNKQPLFSITQYGLQVSSVGIQNVTVEENGQQLNPEVVTTDTKTSIGITFPEAVAGEGKVRKFTLRYQDPNAAIVSGKVLEVIVPKLQKADTYNSYKVTLVTPVSFGSPTRVTPANYTSRVSNSQVVTTFDKLTDQSVIALFGEEQVFDMNLSYHLENPHNGQRYTQVAFPPDTPYQRMNYRSLEPKPDEIEVDEDGNWIATYILPANTITNVNLEAQAHLTLEPNREVFIPKPTNQLLTGKPYWEKNDPVVQTIAENLTTPRSIYDYVVDTLSYNYERIDTSISRLGAASVLQTPDQALCQEFTDAYIALARAKNIPSRRISGYAHTENTVLRPLSLVQDVLHAWPEYYDEEQQLWIPIDPTWGHTSGGVNYFDQFDLNHIVFSINGTDSELPYPAGSYKVLDQNTKDVDVSFGSEIDQVEMNLTVSTSNTMILNSQIVIPFTRHITVTNNTGKAWYNTPFELYVLNDGVQLDGGNQVTVPMILPFQTVKLPVIVYNQSSLIPQRASVQLRYNGSNETVIVTSTPKISSFFTGPELLLTLGVGLFTIAFITGGVLVFRRK